MCIGLPNWLNWLVNPLAPAAYAAKKIGGETAAAVVDPVTYAGKYAAGETDSQKQQRQREKDDAARRQAAQAQPASPSPFTTYNNLGG